MMTTSPRSPFANCTHPFALSRNKIWTQHGAACSSCGSDNVTAEGPSVRPPKCLAFELLCQRVIVNGRILNYDGEWIELSWLRTGTSEEFL
jgi:hypothetical protein